MLLSTKTGLKTFLSFLAITWTKDAVTIEPSEKYQIIDKDDGTCELIVNFATKQDNGKYVCKGIYVFNIVEYHSHHILPKSNKS